MHIYPHEQAFSDVCTCHVASVTNVNMYPSMLQIMLTVFDVAMHGMHGPCMELDRASLRFVDGCCQGGMGNAAAAAVQAVRDASGLPVARELYKQLLKIPPAGGSLMHAVLDIEMEHVSEQEALSNADVDKLFEVRMPCLTSNPQQKQLRLCAC